jgi:uncharacterized OB-fold protein
MKTQCDHYRAVEISRSKFHEDEKVKIILHMQCIKCGVFFGRDLVEEEAEKR